MHVDEVVRRQQEERGSIGQGMLGREMKLGNGSVASWPAIISLSGAPRTVFRVLPLVV